MERPARLLLLLPSLLPGALLWDLWLTQRIFLLRCFLFPLSEGQKRRGRRRAAPLPHRKRRLVNGEERARRPQVGHSRGPGPEQAAGAPPAIFAQGRVLPPRPLSPIPSPCDPLPPNGRPPGPGRALHTTEGLCDLPAPNLVAIGKGRGWRECVGPIHAPSPDSRCP